MRRPHRGRCNNFSECQQILLLALSFTLLDPHWCIDVFHGVAPQHAPLYATARAGGTFACLDRFHEIPGTYVNDDFCDCDDGSDEPGTGACAGRDGASFYCKNELFFPKVLPASRVSDGVCDCCDGSDELYSRRMSRCENTCANHASALQFDLQERRAALLDGLNMRSSNDQRMSATVSSWRAEKEQLEVDIASMEEERLASRQLLNISDEGTNATELATLGSSTPVRDPTEHVVFEDDFEAKGMFKKTWKIVEGGRGSMFRDRERGKVLAMNSCTWGGDTFSKASFSCSVGDECRISFWAKGAPWQGFSRRARRTTDELKDAHSWFAVPAAQGDFPDRLASPETSSAWKYYEYEFPQDDAFQMFGSDEHRFSTAPVHIMLQAHSSTGQCVTTMFDSFRVVKFGRAAAQLADVPSMGTSTNTTPQGGSAISEYAKWAVAEEGTAASGGDKLAEGDVIDVSSDSSRAQNDGARNFSARATNSGFHNDTVVGLIALEKQLRTARARSKSLEKKINYSKDDSGLRWTSMIDTCVTNTLGEYNYTLCFFLHAKQGSMSLGNFDGWDASRPNVMKFSHGHHCHGGPARTLNVQFVCGRTEEILEIAEPARCSYEATVSSHCACDRDGLKLLNERIDALARPPQSGHSEL